MEFHLTFVWFHYTRRNFFRQYLIFLRFKFHETIMIYPKKDYCNIISFNLFEKTKEHSSVFALYTIPLCKTKGS